MPTRRNGRGRHLSLAGLAMGVVLVGASCVSTTTPSPVPTSSASSIPSATAATEPSSASASDGPEPTPGGPSTGAPATAAGLIEAAEAAGRIDGPTALLYRVYAVNGDSRLPAEFAGGAWSEDNDAVSLAAETVDSLPTSIAEELRPFVVRPTDPVSVYFGEPATAAADSAVPTVESAPFRVAALDPAGGPAYDVRLAVAVAAVHCTSTGWGYADGGTRIRVWGRCQRDELEMEAVAAWLDDSWTAERGYLGRDPIPDLGGVDQGADPDHPATDPGATRIDVYLTRGCVTRGGECHSPKRTAVTSTSREYRGTGIARRTSGFIVLNLDIVGQPLLARVVLAHELFHVFEHAFNSGGVHTGVEKHWFVEASAVWAQYRFVPQAVTVNDRTMTDARFDGFQDSPLSLNTSILENDYWSFAWPLFMDQESPGAVARAWQAIEGKTSDGAIDMAINGVLPFATRFHDFAVRAYNRELSPTQDAALQKLFPVEAVNTPRTEPGGVRRDPVVQLHAELPDVNEYQRSESIASLYAVYRPFKVDDDVGKIVVDFSGVSPQASFDVDAIVKIKGKGWERRKLTNGETTFCRDTAKDRVEEMILVVSNHEMRPGAHVAGDWTLKSLQTGCAAITGVLTITREASYLQLDPRLPAERSDEHLSATIVVNLRPDEDNGGYTDGWDPTQPYSVSSTYTISRTTGSSKQMGDCTASFSTKSVGKWAIKDHPTGPDDENSFTGFVDRTFGIAGFSIVVHYPYEVIEDICNLGSQVNYGVHDAFICLDAKVVEIDGAPDQIVVNCSSDAPGLGYTKSVETISGTLYLADE